ncbi:MAG: class I SAM-dependent methyltransferase [Chloroflexota bacterium]
MRRIHLFEFTDQPWYPQTFRRIQTDYLQFVATLSPAYQRLAPLFVKAMQHAGTKEIIDLCSGGSGPWLRLQAQLAQAGWPVTVSLTDKYPSPEALQKWAGDSRQGIQYLAEPVDALHVPAHLKGMRTLFEGFHHFRPEQARAILQGAANQRAAIAIVEADLKPPLGWLLLLLTPEVTPLSYLLLTPWIKPRRLWRFLWTYLLPLVPLATCWDGIVSLLRVYSPQALRELTASLDCPGYTWEIGQAETGAPVFVFTYLVGYPNQEQDADLR